MSNAAYRAIVAHYLDPKSDTLPSFKAVARATNRSERTVKRVFHYGANGLPSVAALLEERAQRERAKRLAEAERVSQYLRGTFNGVLSKVGPQLNALDFTVSPARDTRSTREALNVLKTLAELGREVHGEPEKPSTTVNVNVGPYQPASVDPIAAREAAQSIMLRHAELFARVTGTPEEAEVVAALLAGQARRQAAQNDEEEDE